MIPEKIKPHIHRLPIVPFKKYNAYNDELCIVIPLFGSDYETVTGRPFSNESFKNVHCKGAIWAAMSLAHNTDLGAYGVNVIFYVEERVADAAAEVFTAFDVPDEMIMTFSMKSEGTDYPRARFGKKLAPCLDNRLDYDTLIIWDSDCFICVPNLSVAIYDIFASNILKVRPSCYTIRFEFEHEPIRNLYYRFCRAVGDHGTQHITPQQQVEHIQSIFNRTGLPQQNIDPDKGCIFPHNNMQLFTYPKRNFSQSDPIGFHGFLERNIENCYDDESLYLIWEIGTPYAFLSLEEILQRFNIKTAWVEDNLIAYHHERQPHIAHIHLLEEESRVDAYYDEFYRTLSHNIIG